MTVLNDVRLNADTITDALPAGGAVVEAETRPIEAVLEARARRPDVDGIRDSYRKSGAHFAAFAIGARPSTLGFDQPAARITEGHAVPGGYRTAILAAADETGRPALGADPHLLGYWPGDDADAGWLAVGDDGVNQGPRLVRVMRRGGGWRIPEIQDLAGTEAPHGTAASGCMTPWGSLLAGGEGGVAQEWRGAGAGAQPRPDLGSLCHAGIGFAQNRDGRIAGYFCDGGAGGALYRYVSHPRAATPLEGGTLAVARFADDGTLTWRPLIWGTDRLGADGGFADHRAVLANARGAARRIGATALGRPHDLTVNPVNQRIYLLIRRSLGNGFLVLEIQAPDNDHTQDGYRWDTLLDDAGHGHPDQRDQGSRVNLPTRLAADPTGRLWIATDADGAAENARAHGVHACDVDGPGRGLTQLFFRAPRGAGVSTPVFSADARILFVAVRYPKRAARGPAWPDFDPARGPRSAIVAIDRDDGRLIGC